jgi:hypothetical protein
MPERRRATIEVRVTAQEDDRARVSIYSAALELDAGMIASNVVRAIGTGVESAHYGSADATERAVELSDAIARFIEEQLRTWILACEIADRSSPPRPSCTCGGSTWHNTNCPVVARV